MTSLEELKRGAAITGLVPDEMVTVVDVEWHGQDAITLTFNYANGRPDSQIIFRDSEPQIEIVTSGRPWSFDSDGSNFRLVSEAHRIGLAYLFDPLLAVHSSLIDPLPHQITAVYDEMLPRQPLRFLLADDPGAGKTIMAGLFIKELLMRGDLQRCLVICPGNLVEQWQDELTVKFHLPFEILTRDKIDAARTGNWFDENHLAICRLDQLARNEDLQAQLEQTDWDLVVVDEAHKMSATYFGGDAHYTKRYHLGQLAGSITRHLLLMTATPHNGKEADFQLFMALLDSDRFEGRYRDGVHTVDANDMIRRLLKEQLLKFDGKPLFPERRAYTVPYTLTDAEAALYSRVTDYVRDEFDRAESLENEGRRGTIGFALTILQRRVASSPEAIYQSLKRRRERLEQRVRDEKIQQRGERLQLEWSRELPSITADDIDDIDDLPPEEATETEEQVVDLASAARTIAELEAEIETLRGLEQTANEVRRSGMDRKWEELSSLLQDEARMFDQHGQRRKLVIFTEHRDTMNYLTARLRTLLGRDEAVVTIAGGMGREERRTSQELFTQDKDVQILVATDAAGEGINLQRAHLMVNYDLPWNPNRLEQRFGRIHRIGQTEVCYLWNLVSTETREGAVFDALFKKLERERDALGGQVFDVLGQVTFENRPLRELLVEAIRYGSQPEVRDRLSEVVDGALDREHLRELLQQRSLVTDVMNAGIVQQVREEMERAEARRLQPFYIQSFFLEAFKLLGGRIHEREPKRYEITRVPGSIRQRDRAIGVREPVLRRYERVTFEKDQINLPGRPTAEFIAPGHPLLKATLDLILERHRDLLKRGAVLVDPDDPGEEVRALYYLEHAIQDGRPAKNGRREISRQLQFVEIGESGQIWTAGYAPYLDYRPITEEEQQIVQDRLEAEWLHDDIERTALNYAITNLVPRHRDEVRARREEAIEKTTHAVKDRLTKEISYWDNRATELEYQERAGKKPKLNSARARQRADDLTDRYHRRMRELEQERQIAPLPPVVAGGALIVPAGLLNRYGSSADTEASVDPAARARIEQLAMNAVMEVEQALGNQPVDISVENRGWDIESRDPETGRLRFIEVKGRTHDARDITVTRNEIMAARNKPDDHILAIVLVKNDQAGEPCYIRHAFQSDPDFGVTSVNYTLKHLLSRSGSANGTHQ